MRHAQLLYFDDTSFQETARFREVKTPILALGLTDDVWGTPRAIASLVRHYENAPVELRWLSPKDGGGQKIGHLGFFRSRFALTLWQPLVAWLLDGTPMMIGRKGLAAEGFEIQVRASRKWLISRTGPERA